MEGETRTNLNYLEQLSKFHRQQGHPVHKIPQLDKRPIDLFRLRKEVAARGGYQKVRSASYIFLVMRFNSMLKRTNSDYITI
jgi:hypothetical protein